jgi:hypothetical protein
MYSIGKKHIRVFFFWESIGKWTTTVQKAWSDTMDKVVDTGKKGLNTVSNTASGAIEAMGSDIVDKLKSSVENAEKSSNQSTKDTLKILKATWALIDTWMFDISNKLRLAKRWWEWSGKIWAQKIIEALDKAEKWEPQIVTYSNNKYESWSLKEYENLIKKDTWTMNVNAMKWLYSLIWSNIGFKKETWEKIGLYIYSRKWVSNLLKDIPWARWPLMELGAKEAKKEEIELTNITTNILKKIKLENPKIEQLLKNTALKVKPDGKTIDVWQILYEFEKNWEKLNIKEIEQKFRELAETLKKNWEVMINSWKEKLKKIHGNPKTLREVGINTIPFVVDGKTVDISENLILTADPQKAWAMIIAIDKYQKTLNKTSKDFDEKNNILDSIKEGLIQVRKWKETIWYAAQTDMVAHDAKRHREKWWTKETFTWPKVEVLEATNNVAIARAQSESTRSDLKEYNIHTLEQAQTRLHEIWDKATKADLSPDDIYLKKLLDQYIQDNKRVAIEYVTVVRVFGEADAKYIFTQTNQFISGNPKETYNFQALEKIATLTDPESTPSQRSLARLEVGQSVSMNDLLRWNSEISVSSAPEISQVTISKNPDGTFNIPLFEARNITKDQVNEYQEDTRLYAELGLSQLIPHIPLLTRELRNKWINTAIDGKTGTMEQQQILKSLYTQLFWKEIISSSLTEVERAFSSALGNPTNMKNAMQGVLSTHHLIAGSGQSIVPDTLQNWMRQNTQDNQKSTINLT